MVNIIHVYARCECLLLVVTKGSRPKTFPLKVSRLILNLKAHQVVLTFQIEAERCCAAAAAACTCTLVIVSVQLKTECAIYLSSLDLIINSTSLLFGCSSPPLYSCFIYLHLGT